MLATATWVWLKLAGSQLVLDRWQSPHGWPAGTATWRGVLPVAARPVWQVWQPTVLTTLWRNLVRVKDWVLWHSAQPTTAGTCFCGTTTLALASADPAVWQPSQVRGVPFIVPPRWQVSQRCTAWAPVSG